MQSSNRHHDLESVPTNPFNNGQIPRELPLWMRDPKKFLLDWFSRSRANIVPCTEEYASELTRWRKCQKVSTATRIKAVLKRIMIILYSHMSYVDGKKILASEIEEELISLATMYIDMELKVYLKKREEIIQTSGGSDALTEHERRIPDRILHWLYTILSGHTNRVDALLSLQTVYAKNAKAILDPIFRKVLSEMSPGPLTDISYVRYVLACKLWRERVLYQEDESSKALHQRIVSNLVPVNSYDTFNESLRNCLNKTPRNETNVAKYHLLPHTVNLRLSCELFLKCSQLPTEEINFARISLVDDELEDDEDCQINKLMRMISERKTKFVGFIDLTGDDEPPERPTSPELELDHETRDESIINTSVFTTIEPMDETATVQTLSSSPAGDEPLEITAMVETPTVVTTIVEQQMVQTTVLTQTTMVPSTSTVVTLAAPTSIVPTLAALTQAVAMHAVPTSSEIPTSIVSTSAIPTSISTTLEAPTSITTSEAPTSINTTSEPPTLINTTLEASTSIKTTSEVSTLVKTTLEAPPPTLEVPTSLFTTLKVPTSLVTTLKVPTDTLAAAAAATTTTTTAAPSTLQSTLTSENLRITEENVYISPQLLNLFIMCASPEEQRRLNQSIQISQSGHLNLDLRNGSIKEAIDNFRKQQQLKKDTAHVKNETLIKSDLDAQIELLLDLRTKSFASTEPPPPASIPPSTPETTPVSRELFPNNSEPPVVPPECNTEEINKFCDDLFASDLTVVSDKHKQNTTSDRTLVTEDSAAFVPQKQLSNVEMTSNRLRSSPIRTTKRSTYSRQLSDKRKSRLRPYHGSRSELDRRHRNIPGVERRHRNLPHTITSRSTHDVEADQESPVDLRSTPPEVTQTESDPSQKDTLRCKPLVELTQSVPAMPAGCSVPDKSPQPEIDATDQNIPVSDSINEEILVEEINNTILDESNLNDTILDESTVLEDLTPTLEAHVEVLGEEEHLPEAIGPEESEEIDESPTEGMSNEDLISEMVNNDEIYTPKAILCTKPLIDVTTNLEDEINSLKTLVNNNENISEEVINLKTSVSSEIDATSVQTDDIHDKQINESVLDSSIAAPIIDEELTQNQDELIVKEVEKHTKIETGELFIENTCHIEQIPVVNNVVSVYESVKISEAPKVAKVEEIAAVEEVALIEQTAEIQQVVTVKEVPVVHEVASVHHVALLEAVATIKQVATVTNLATVTETITITPEISTILEDQQPAPLGPSEKFKKPPIKRRRRKSFLSPKTKRKPGPKQELIRKTIVDTMLEAQNKLIQIKKSQLTINNPVEKPAKKVKQRVIVTEETIEPEEKTPRRGRTRRQPLGLAVEPTKPEELVETPVQSSVTPEEVVLEVPEVVLLPEVDKLKTKRGRKRKEPLVESVQDESLPETRPKRQKQPTEDEPVAELVDTNQNSTSRRKKAPPCHISTVKLPLEVLSTVSQEQLNPSVLESVEKPVQIVPESKRRGRKQNLSTIVLDDSLIPPELLQVSSCSNIEQEKQLKIMLNKYSDTDLMSLGQKTTRRDRPGPLSSKTKKSAPAVEEVVVDGSKVLEIEEELEEVVKNRVKDVKSRKKGVKSKDIPAKIPEIVPVTDVVDNDLQIPPENINTQDTTTDEIVPVKSTKSRKKSARGPPQRVAEIPEISAESKDTKSRRKSITPKVQEIELKDEDNQQKLTAKAKAQSLQDISLKEEVVLPNKNQKTRKKAKSLQDVSIDSGKSKKKGKLKQENEAEIKIVEDLKPQKELKKPLDEPVAKNESTFLIDEALYDAILMEEAKTIKKEQAKKKAEKLEQIKTQESVLIAEEQPPDTKVEKELVKDIKSLKKAAILEVQKGVPDTPKIQDIKSRRKSAILEHKTIEIPSVTVADSVQPVKDIKSRKKAAILEQAAVVPVEEAANPLTTASPETKIEPIKDIKSLKKAAIMEQAKILEKATIPNEEIIQIVISTEETTNTEDKPTENTLMEVEKINIPVGKTTAENVPIMEELKTNDVPLEEATKSKKKITKTKVPPVEELQPVIKSRRKLKILPEEIKETPAQTRNSTKKDPKPVQIDEESKEIKPRKRIQKKKLEEFETTLEDEEEIPLVELIQKPVVLPKKRGRPRKIKQKLAQPETKATKVDDKLKLKVLLPEEIMQRYCPENPSGSDTNNTSFNNATNHGTKLNKQTTKTSDKPQNTRQGKTYKSKTTKLKSFDATDDLIFVGVTPNEDFVSILKEEKFNIADLNLSEPSEHSINITLPAEEEIRESLNNTTSDKQLEEGTLIQEVITENVEIQSEQIKPDETQVKLSEKVEQPQDIVAPEIIPEQSIQPVVNLEETQPDIVFSEDTSVESTTQISTLEEPEEIVEPPKKHGKKLKTTGKVGKPIEKSKKSTKPVEPPLDSTEIQLQTTTAIQETTEKSSNLTEIAVQTVETSKKSTESVEDSQPVVLSVDVDQNQLETVVVDEEANEKSLEKSNKSIKTTEQSQPLELPIDPKEEELKTAPSIEETIEKSQPIESSELPFDSEELQLETTAIGEDITEKPLNLKEIDGKIVEKSEKSPETLQPEEKLFDFKENQLKTTATIDETTEELPNVDETALKLVEKLRESTKTTEKLQSEEAPLITKDNTLETEGIAGEATEKLLNFEEIKGRTLEKSKKSTDTKEVQLETAPAVEETIEKPLNSEEITLKPLEKSKKSTKSVENKEPVVSSLVIEPNQLETAAIYIETTENLQPIKPSLDSDDKQLESTVISEEITKITEPFEPSSNFEQNKVETAEKSQNFVENIKKPLEKSKKKRKTSSNEQKPVETPAETLEQQIKTTEESSTEIKIHPEPFLPEETQEPLLISQVEMENKLKISETTPNLVETSEVVEKTQEKPVISRKRTKSTKKAIKSVPEKVFADEIVTQNSDKIEDRSKTTQIVVEITSDLDLNQKSLDTTFDELKNEIKPSEESQKLLESPLETKESLESVMEPQEPTELPVESSRTEDTLEIIIETVETSDQKSKVTENFEKSFESPIDLSSSEETSKELTESSETEVLLPIVVTNNEEPVTISQPEKKTKKKSKPAEKMQKSTELPIETTITLESTEMTEKSIELPTVSEDIQKMVPLPERITRRKSKLIEKPSTEPCTFIELPKMDVQPLEEPIIVVKSEQETSSSEKLQNKNSEKKIEIDTAYSIPEIVPRTSETINKTVDSMKIEPDILPSEKKSKKKLKPSETKQIIDKTSPPEPQEIVEVTKKIDKSFEIPTNIPLEKSEYKIKQKGKKLKVKIGNEYVNLQIDTSIVVNAGKSGRELKTAEKCDELPKKELVVPEIMDKFKKKLKASNEQQDLVETKTEIDETKLEVPEIVPEPTKLIESSPEIAEETVLKKPSIVVENDKPGKKSNKVQKPIVSTPKMEEITPETLPIVVETQISEEETLITPPMEPLLKVDVITSEKSSIVVVEKDKSGKKTSIKSQKLIESSPKIVETTPSSIVEHTENLQITSEISSIVTENDESEKKSTNKPSKCDQTASEAAVLPEPKENTQKSDEPSPKFNKTELKDVEIVEISEKKSCETPEIVINKKSVAKSQKIVESSPKIDVIEAPEVIPVEKSTKKLRTSQKTQDIPTKPEEITTELLDQLDDQTKSSNSKKSKGKNLKIKVGNDYINLQIDTSTFKTNNIDAKPKRSTMKDSKSCEVSENKLSEASGTVLEAKKLDGSMENIENTLNPPIINTLSVEIPQLTYEKSSILAPIQRKSTDIVSISQILDNKEAKSPEKLKQDTELISMFIQKNKLDSDLIIQEIDDILMKEDDTEPSTSSKRKLKMYEKLDVPVKNENLGKQIERKLKKSRKPKSKLNHFPKYQDQMTADDDASKNSEDLNLVELSKELAAKPEVSSNAGDNFDFHLKLKSYENNKNKFISSESDSNSDLIIDTSLESTDSEFNCNLKNNTKLYKRYIAKVVPDTVAKTNSYLKTGKISEDKINHGQVGEEINVEGETLELESTKPDEQCAKESVVKCSVNGMYKITKSPALIKNPVIKYLPSFQDTTKIFTEPRPHCSAKENVQKSNLSSSTRNIVQVFVTPAPKPVPNFANISPDENYGLNLLANYAFDLEHIDNKPETNGPIFVNEECAMDKDDYCMLVAYPDDVPESDNPAEYFTTFDVNSGEESIHKIQQLTPFPRKATDKNRNGGDFYNISLDDMINSNPNYSYFLHKEQPPRESGMHQDPRPHTTFDPIPIVIPNTADLQLVPDDDDFPLNHMYKKPSTHTYNTLQTPKHFPEHLLEPPKKKKINYALETGVAKDFTNDISFLADSQLDSKLDKTKKHKSPIRDASYLLNKYKTVEKSPPVPASSPNLSKSPPSYIRSTRPQRMVTTTRKRRNSVIDLSTKKSKSDALFNKLLEDQKLLDSTPVFNENKHYENTLPSLEPTHVPAPIIPLPVVEHSNPIPWRIENILPTIPTTVTESVDATITKIELTNTIATTSVFSPVAATTPLVAATATKPKKPMKEYKKISDVITKLMDRTIDQAEKLLEKIDQPKVDLPKVDLPKDLEIIEIPDDDDIPEKIKTPEPIIEVPDLVKMNKIPKELEIIPLEDKTLAVEVRPADVDLPEDTKEEELVETPIKMVDSVEIATEIEVDSVAVEEQVPPPVPQPEELPSLNDTKLEVVPEIVIPEIVVVPEIIPESTELVIETPVVEEMITESIQVENDTITESMQVEKTQTESVQVEKIVTESIQVDKTVTETIEEVKVVENRSTTAVEVVEEWLNRTDNKPSPEPYVEISTIEECNFFEELSSSSTAGSSIRKPDEKAYSTEYQTPDSGIVFDEDSTQKDKQLSEPDSCYNSDQPQEPEKTHQSGTVSFKCSIPLSKLPDILPRLLALRSERKEITLIKNKKRKSENLDELKIKKRKHLPETDSETQPSSDEASVSTPLRTKGSVKEYPDILFRITSPVPSGSCCINSPYPSDISLQEEPTFYVEGGINVWTDFQDQYYESFDSLKEQQGIQFNAEKSTDEQQSLQAGYCVNDSQFTLPMNDGDILSMIIDNNMIIENNMIIDKRMVAVNMHQVQPEMKPHTEQKEETELCLNTLCPDDVQFINMDQISSECQVVIGGEDNSNSVGTFEELIPMPTVDLNSTPPPLISLNPDKKLDETINLPPTEVMIESPEIIIHPDIITEPTIIPEPPSKPRRISTLEEDKTPTKKPTPKDLDETGKKPLTSFSYIRAKNKDTTPNLSRTKDLYAFSNDPISKDPIKPKLIQKSPSSTDFPYKLPAQKIDSTNKTKILSPAALKSYDAGQKTQILNSAVLKPYETSPLRSPTASAIQITSPGGSRSDLRPQITSPKPQITIPAAVKPLGIVTASPTTRRTNYVSPAAVRPQMTSPGFKTEMIPSPTAGIQMASPSAVKSEPRTPILSPVSGQSYDRSHLVSAVNPPILSPAAMRATPTYISPAPRYKSSPGPVRPHDTRSQQSTTQRTPIKPEQRHQVTPVTSRNDSRQKLYDRASSSTVPIPQRPDTRSRTDFKSRQDLRKSPQRRNIDYEFDQLIASTNNQTKQEKPQQKPTADRLRPTPYERKPGGPHTDPPRYERRFPHDQSPRYNMRLPATTARKYPTAGRAEDVRVQPNHYRPRTDPFHNTCYDKRNSSTSGAKVMKAEDSAASAKSSKSGDWLDDNSVLSQLIKESYHKKYK